MEDAMGGRDDLELAKVRRKIRQSMRTQLDLDLVGDACLCGILAGSQRWLSIIMETREDIGWMARAERQTATLGFRRARALISGWLAVAAIQ